MFALKKPKKDKSHKIQDYIPWANFVPQSMTAEAVVFQKEGALQRTFAYKGPDLDTADAKYIAHNTDQLSQAINRLGSGWAVYFEAQRTSVAEYPFSRFDNEIAQDIEDERAEYYTQENSHYENSYYLTFVYEPPSDASKKGQKSLGLTTTVEAELDDFIDTTTDMAAILSNIAVIQPLTRGETLAYLHSSVSFDWHTYQEPYDLSIMHIDYIIADTAVEIYTKSLLFDAFPHPIHVRIVSISDFPHATFPGILRAMNSLQLEFRYVSRLVTMDKEEAQKKLESYGAKYADARKSLRKLLSGGAQKGAVQQGRDNIGAIALEGQVDEALVDLATDVVGFGYTTNTVILWDTKWEALNNKLTAVKQVIQSQGFTAKIESMNSFEAFLGSMPGNVYANLRRPIISTLNFAHAVPLTSVWTGDEVNHHMEKITGNGAPLLLTGTHTKTPFNLNLNKSDDDVGHTFIAGPSGAGKSTLLGIMALQWLKYPKSQVIIFDKDRSAQNTTEAIGGRYYEPGGDLLTFQPLRELETNQDLIFAAEFIGVLLTLQNVEVITPEMREQIQLALESMQGIDSVDRTITTFLHTIQDESKTMVPALQAYRADGMYGNLFDSADDEDIAIAKWTMFEMSILMDLGNAVITPVLMYLFHYLDKHVFKAGKPTLLVLDEAWLFLSHPYFQTMIKNWFKTLRKKHVFVIFATQEVTDAANSPIASTIIQQTPTKIYLPDPEANSPALRAMYSTLGLLDSEIESIAQGTKKRDYLYKSAEGTRMFQLDLGKSALEVITSKNFIGGSI